MTRNRNLRSDRRIKRQTEAKERQARWDDMSDEERTALHASRGYRYIPKEKASV